MKKNTKGFTLIELLAVIVILAIIALIATPIVLNLINKARKGAAQDGCYGVRKSAQLYYQTKLIDAPEENFTDTVIKFKSDATVTVPNSWDAAKTVASVKTDGFELDGTVPDEGWVSITTSGKIAGCVMLNNHYCSIGNSGEIKCDKDGVDAVAATGAPDCKAETDLTTASASAAA